MNKADNMGKIIFEQGEYTAIVESKKETHNVQIFDDRFPNELTEFEVKQCGDIEFFMLPIMDAQKFKEISEIVIFALGKLDNERR